MLNSKLKLKLNDDTDVYDDKETKIEKNLKTSTRTRKTKKEILLERNVNIEVVFFFFFSNLFNIFFKKKILLLLFFQFFCKNHWFKQK
jgi:hypothetical protein